MYYHNFQQSLNHLMQTEEQRVTQTFLEMQCQRSGPFGTGGLMCVGTDPFTSSFTFPSRQALLNSSENNDIVSTNPCALKIPFDFELIARTLEKVVFEEGQKITRTNSTSKVEKTISTKAKAAAKNKSKSPSRNMEESFEIESTTAKNVNIQHRLLNMSCNDSFDFLGGFETKEPSALSPEICHDWWGWGWGESNNSPVAVAGPSGGSENNTKSSKNKDSKGDGRMSHSNSETNNSPKTVGGVKRRSDSDGNCHSKKIEDDASTCDRDRGSRGRDDESNLHSVTIVINEEDMRSEDEDDTMPGKRPNTHKKGRPPPSGESSKKQVTRRIRRNYRDSAKASSGKNNKTNPNPRNKPRVAMDSEADSPPKSNHSRRRRRRSTKESRS